IFVARRRLIERGVQDDCDGRNPLPIFRTRSRDNRMHANELHRWGATESVLTEATTHPNLTLARVITQERGQYTVLSAHGEHSAVVAGKLIYNTDDVTALPGVGDWVMIAGDDDLAVIQEILSRSSCIVRKAAGPTQRGQ